MRLFSLILYAVMLGACATTSPVSDTAGFGEAGLETKSSAVGGCGLYGWTTDAARDFVFYADHETARYDSVTGPVDLTAERDFPSTLYSDPSGRRVELRLGAGETMDGGIRFPTARIVTQTDEGWERLRPIAVVQNCAVK